MRDDVLMALIDRAMSDPAWRQRATVDLDAALDEAGLDLDEDELAAVREFQAAVQGLSDEELEAQLTGDGRLRGGA